MQFAEAIEIMRAKKNDWKEDKLTPEEDAAWDLLSQIPPEEWPRAKRVDNPRKVALIGKGGGHLVVPWTEEGWEFWGLNEQSRRQIGIPPLEHYDRWFQIHPPRYLERHYPEGMVDLEAWWGPQRVDDGSFVGRSIPLYMDRAYMQYPDSVAYPKEEAEALTSHGWYHASSLDWMVALAILEGFEHILVAAAGFDSFPVTNGEPLSARPCLEYWSGVAEGRGIEVEYAGPSGHMFQILHMVTLQSRHQYGFDDEPGRDLGEVSDWREFR